MAAIKPVAHRTEETIARLLDIWASAVVKTHTFLSEADITAIRPEAQSGIRAIESLHCFCDDDGIMQGFIGVENDKIEMLFVDADARGCGIGKRLIAFAVSDLGAKYVDVNEQNEQAVGFYRHMGFDTIGRSACDDQGRPFPILHLGLQ